MASVWAELKRRNVVRVAVAYAVIAWLLIEVASTLFPLLQLPDWTATFVAMLLLMGFPVALTLSWAYELTPEGIKKTRNVPLEESISRVTGQKFNFLVTGVLALAVIFLLVDGYLEDSAPISTPAIDLDTTAASPPDQETASDVLPNSVAVLPFEDMSANPEYAYFAPGIHDEILHQLARLENLNVIARTSVMQYAGAARPITEIARELSVETIMEGSVSYAEGRVAIRAQLIDAETGVHLWSESYNREFSDVFAIQADIAMNVANALEAEFSPAEQAQLEQIPTDNPIAYELYLRALSTGRDGGLAGVHDDLDQAIMLDPGFALAHALKSYSYAGSLEGGSVGPGEVVTLVPLAQEYAESALALDPNIGMAHSALAILHTNAGNLAEAQAAYERAMELSSQDPLIRFVYTRFLRYIGRLDDALRVSQRSAELGPNDRFNYTQLGFSYWYLGDYESAATAFRRGIALDPGAPQYHLWLGLVEASGSQDEEAIRELAASEQLWGEDISTLRLAQSAFAYSQMDRREEAVRFFNRLQERAQEEPVAESVWAMAYYATGDYDEAYRRLESALSNPLATEQISLAELKANPYGNALLDEPHWQEIRDRIGQF